MNWLELTPLALVQLLVAAVALAGVAGVSVYLWKHPTPGMYQSQLETFQRDLKQTREDLRQTRLELQDERQESRRNSEDLQKVLERNRQLYNELQRQSEIYAWVQERLRERNIILPPLPRELRESRLDAPAVSISIEQTSAGLVIKDNAQVGSRDIIGGDVRLPTDG